MQLSMSGKGNESPSGGVSGDLLILIEEILMTIFRHSRETAEKLTLDIHNDGSGIAGTFTFEIAEQKGTEATLLSRNAGFPLNIKIEKA